MNDHRPCAREGCPGQRPSPGSPFGHHDYCTVTCRMVEQFIGKAEDVCRSNPSPEAAEVYAAAVALGDAQSALRRLVVRATGPSSQFRGPTGSPLAPTTKTGR